MFTNRIEDDGRGEDQSINAPHFFQEEEKLTNVLLNNFIRRIILIILVLRHTLYTSNIFHRRYLIDYRRQDYHYETFTFHHSQRLG